MKKLALALAVTAAFAGPAMAADLAVKARPAPPPVPVANWTGCYISGGVGYGLYDNERTTFSGPPLTPVITQYTAPFDEGGRGWLAGGGGGCDYQFGLGSGGGFFGTGQFVIGILADGYWSNMRGNSSSIVVGNFATAQEKVDSQWAVGGRIGWLMSPNLLTYFSGGYTEATVTGVGDFAVSTGLGGGLLGASLPGRTVKGWFLGSGVEYQSGWIPGLTWKTEYRFSEYGRVDRFERFNGGGALDGAPGTLVGTASSDKLFIQTVMTSLVYRFNWGGPVVPNY